MHYYQDLGIFLYLTPIVASLWSAYALLINKDRTFSQLYLAIAFIMMSIGMTFSFWYDRYASENDLILRIVNLIFSVFSTISIYIYFASLMRPDKLTSKYLFRWIIVGLLYTLALLIPALLYDLPDNISGWNAVLSNLSHPIIFIRLISGISIIIFEICIFILVIRMYIRHRRFIKGSYSYKEEIGLNWILYTAILFSIFGLFDILWIVDSCIVIKYIFNIISIYVIIWIFYLGTRQKEVPIAKKEKEKKKEEKALSQHLQNKIEKKLLDYFEKEQPYLDSELSLNDVAEALSTNRTYLSRILNHSFNTSFYSFVNKYRIEYAIKQINENEEISIDELFLASGFKSRSVFYRQFKIHTSYSPLNYIKRAENPIDDSTTNNNEQDDISSKEQ